MERKAALQQAIDELARQREEIARQREEISAQRAEIERLRNGADGAPAVHAASTTNAHEPIAIVGMACRFPGAANIDEYWQLLARGGDAVTEVPADRWPAAAFYDADPSAAGKMSTRQGAFIRGVDQFDPQFFGIAPREAQSMDPQQRLLLEVTWEALEHANISPADLHGTATGVFVGITCFDHAIRLSQTPENFNAYAGTGSALNMAPGRLSYVLGLTGPSMAIDTACSSSLVGLHLACQSLRSGETSAVIAGGVHLILSPQVMVSFSQARMLSADGRSKTFDASADGYSRGEGCGVVVLKRLADAIAAGDTVHGILRGTAVNQDGPSGGLTVPNGASQQAVIRRALAAAGVAAADVGYVETHGTGTSLGDPIEIEALAKVYGAARSTSAPLIVGSVKTNIGHLEPAAGMAGLIKLLLAFRHEQVPRHLHFTTPNPHIPWRDIPIAVASSATPWPRSDRPRIAGLSAFGFSGTNGHVIVEEPPPTPPAPRDDRLQLLALSAKTESALKALAARYAEMFAWNANVNLASVAYAAGAGRAHFAHRMTLIAGSVEEAARALASFMADGSAPAVRVGKAAGAGYRRDAAEVQARLEAAYASRALTDIADLYLQGIDIDWRRLFEHGAPPRAALPSYPFERQRYWVDTPDQQTRAASDPAAPVASGDSSASLRYRLIWTNAGSASASAARGEHRRWQIDADSAHDGLTAALSGALPLDDRPTDILYIRSDRSHDPSRACAGLLALAHRVAAAGGAAPRIWVVTRGALPAGGAMTADGVAHAPLAAFARVLGLEHPEMFGRLIDLDPAGSADDLRALLAETARDDAEDQVAIRNGERFVQRVEREDEALPSAAPLRADAAYLITGGLGRIGLQVAGDLARRGAKHLWLVSRRGVSTTEQGTAVDAAVAAGANVRVAQADVTDRAAMAALIRGIAAERPLAGVLHAAGLPGYTDIAQLTADDVSAVLAPKVQGAWILHELTRDQPLDFFVAFSSIASAWGSRGQAHYAAANACLDALAYLRRAEGLPALTINWGPWVDGGMTSPEAEALLRRVGIRPLATREALAAFAALTGASRAPHSPQAIVADIDLALFKGSYEARGRRPLLERMPAPSAHTDAAPPADNALMRRLAAASASRREQLAIDAIAPEVAAVLELGDGARVDPDLGLFEMGLDSLMALELRTRLETLTSRSLPATLVFDYPTIRAMAKLVASAVAAAAGSADIDPSAAGPATARGDAAANAASTIDDLTDAEAEALLLKKLDALR